jgi:hypothetical protein
MAQTNPEKENGASLWEKLTSSVSREQIEKKLGLAIATVGLVAASFGSPATSTAQTPVGPKGKPQTSTVYQYDPKRVLAPKEGEIILTGTLTNITGNNRGVLKAISYTNPGGKTKSIEPFKLKQFTLVPDVVASVNGVLRREMNLGEVVDKQDVTLNLVGLNIDNRLIVRAYDVSLPVPIPDRIPVAEAKNVDSFTSGMDIGRQKDLSSIPLASPNDLAIKEHSNHPIAAEGHSIPASLKGLVGLIKFEDIRQDRVNRIYAQYERIVLVDMDRDENIQHKARGTHYRQQMENIEGNVFIFPKNILNREIFDPTGRTDRNAFYLNSITLWNETKNEPIVGDSYFDEKNGNVGIRVKVGSWDEWSGQVVR